jgi:hypothetical protein
MTESWRKLGEVDPKALGDARAHLHYAAQIVSGVGRTWALKEDDDSHANLEWLPSLSALKGQLPPREPALTAALDLAGLRLLLLDAQGQVQAEKRLDGLTVGEGYAWLRGELAARWSGGVGDFTALHYDMPDHALGRGGRFRRDEPEAFEETARWFGNAAGVLGRVRAKHGASPVRCWPHHFDIATLISLEGERSLGVGLSPGDDSYSDPYFYVGPWPHPQPEKWPGLPLGRWHADGFVAAVLTGSELVTRANQAEDLAAFLDSAIEGSRRLLAN